MLLYRRIDLIFVFAVTFIVSTLAAHSQASAQTDPVLSAGAAEAEIDVPEGIALAGYLPRRRLVGKRTALAYYFKPSVGQNDRVRAKALVLREGRQRIVFVSVDLVAIFPRLKEEALRRLADLGLRDSELVLSATHTHSGPGGFADFRFWEILAADRFKPAFFQTIVSSIESAIRQAFREQKKARLGIGNGAIHGLTVNRRRVAAVAPTLTLVRVDSLTGDPIAHLVNFPVHGTLLGIHNYHISGDVPGAIERAIEARFGGISLFVSDAGGDINPQWASPSLAGLEPFGERFVDQASAIRRSVRWQNRVGLSSVATEVSLNEPSLNLFRCMTKGDRPERMPWRSLKKFGLTLPTELSLPLRLRGIRIGDHLFVTVPGEPIAELGKAVLEGGRRAGYSSASVIALSDSYMGYILTEQEYNRGGYETCNSFYGPEYGTQFLIAVDNILQKLR